MRLLSAIVLSAVIPVLGFTQAFAAMAGADVVAASSAFGEEPQHTLTEQLLRTGSGFGQGQGLLPLWSTPDGRVLALIALGGKSITPAQPQSPQIGSAADWQLVDVTSFVTGLASLRLNDNAQAYASFGHGIVLSPLYATGPSPGCEHAVFDMGSLCGNNAMLGQSGMLHLGTDLTVGDVDLDLNYGLSWLRLNDHSVNLPGSQRPMWDLFANLGNEALPTLVIPGIEMANMRNSGFNAQGRWHLDNTGSIDLGAALSRIQFEMPGTPLLPSLNQAALSLGLHHGDFSGVIVGRVLGPGDPINGNPHWSTLDLGISWRSPWRGVFSVGAQNLWSTGNVPALTDPAAHEVDANQARVPYVQYHQDL